MSIALIVDDEVDLCRLMQMTLKKMKIDTLLAYDMATAVEHLAQHRFDFCLTDLNLPDGSGLDIVKLINAKYPNTPVAVITAHGSMDLAIEALKLGAFDFVNKPLELPRLRQLVENALKVAENAKEQAVPTAPDLFAGKLIGESEPIRQLKATIQKLARSQAPVFLWGGSGTGKEVVAKLIHELSPRASASFVPVNCGAIPSELMESEFFGHKKGSFTGATVDKEGLFQQANGGTLFLDEVADLPLAMQVKLLRAIQEKKVRPIGGTQELPVDIRLLSATHKNLAQLVDNGDFRQDLYYRINVIEVKLPSLNDRKDDVLILAKHFLQMIAKDWDLPDTIELTPQAEQALLHHDYSGNVRELRNILERAITLSDGQVIDIDHLHLNANGSSTSTPPTIQAPAIQEPINQTPILASGSTPSQAASINETYPLPNNNPLPAVTIPQTPPLDALGQTTLPPTTGGVTQANTPLKTPAAFNLPKTSPNSYNQGTFEGGNTLRQTVHINTAQPLQPPEPKPNEIIQTLPPIIASVMNTNLFSPVNGNQNTRPAKMLSLPDMPLPPEGLEAYLLNQEKQLIIAALNQCNWNKTHAAKLLNTSFRSLRYRMKKLEIEDDD